MKRSGGSINAEPIGLCCQQVTLLKLLKVYEVVLQREGMSATNDIHLYNFLLQLSLGTEPDWWMRFERLAELNARYGCACRRCKACVTVETEHIQVPMQYDRLSHYLNTDRDINGTHWGYLVFVSS